MSGYDALTIRVSAAEAELAVAELWARGTLGLETRDEDGRVVLTAYFERGRLGPDRWAPGETTLGGLPVKVVSVDSLDERDWLADYRCRAVPFALGARFWVDPGEPDGLGEAVEVPSGRFLLRLPARRAFGTGSHESTRLVVEALESIGLAGKRVLDVGSGSGVLSFVASRLGAAAVVALESDPVAAHLAGRNQLLNQLWFPLLAGRVQALAELALFDLALVNVIPERVEADLADIARRLRRGAGAVFSGCLLEQAREYSITLERHGFRIVSTRDLGEWRAFLTESSDR